MKQKLVKVTVLYIFLSLNAMMLEKYHKELIQE